MVVEVRDSNFLLKSLLFKAISSLVTGIAIPPLDKVLVPKPKIVATLPVFISARFQYSTLIYLLKLFRIWYFLRFLSPMVWHIRRGQTDLKFREWVANVEGRLFSTLYQLLLFVYYVPSGQFAVTLQRGRYPLWSLDGLAASSKDFVTLKAVIWLIHTTCMASLLRDFSRRHLKPPQALATVRRLPSLETVGSKRLHHSDRIHTRL
jgi:hypothetical protein